MLINYLLLINIDQISSELSALFGISVALLVIIIILLIILIIMKTKKTWWNMNKKPHMKMISTSEKRMLSSILSEAIISLSENKVGALISIERNVSLDEFIDLGVKIDSEVSAQLLQSIFYKNSPLHDGAVIIRSGRIECASAYFPLTNKKISSQFGSRHRAGLGVSEISDALSIIVSETTGLVSLAKSGKLIQIENLNNLVRTIYDELASSKEISSQKQ